ncbi:hypothetical protein [Acanthopleuribacter pedis]|uniref:Uncharacterized protein n=1 Tax=Acanthopleuribacter pedis TaxID=442870 RepID=A0A8J7Q688_9BACT|nr:hypothetical protein [Acanthopleuribacter pedis]MBO1321262.1 hypothetical protein [Acanthopleuribacter pedis]
MEPKLPHVRPNASQQRLQVGNEPDGRSTQPPPNAQPSGVSKALSQVRQRRKLPVTNQPSQAWQHGHTRTTGGNTTSRREVLDRTTLLLSESADQSTGIPTFNQPMRRETTKLSQDLVNHINNLANEKGIHKFIETKTNEILSHSKDFQNLNTLLEAHDQLKAGNDVDLKAIKKNVSKKDRKKFRKLRKKPPAQRKQALETIISKNKSKLTPEVHDYRRKLTKEVASKLTNQSPKEQKDLREHTQSAKIEVVGKIISPKQHGIVISSARVTARMGEHFNRLLKRPAQ